MTVAEAIVALSRIKDKNLKLRMIAGDGLLIMVGSIKPGYMMQGHTDEDYPTKGWVQCEAEKLPEAVAVIIEPGDED